MPGQQPPSGTRDGSGPEVPDPQPELPDAFAPGLALNADDDPVLDGAGAEPSDAGDPYGPPDDLDTAEAYGPAEEDGTADPYDPSSYGLGALGLVGDDYDTGDEYRPSDNHEAPGQESPLSLIRNSGRPPGQFGAPRLPGPIPGWRSREEPDTGPAEFRAGPGSPARQHAQPQPLAPPPGPQPTPSRTVTADSLTTDLLLPGRHKAPVGGWRRAVFQVTGGLVRAPESAAQRRRRELIARVRTPVTGGHHRVAVMSLKGGVGKTTTTVGLGAMLASLRGDRVIAVDANPDRGTLSDKVRLETAATVRDLLNEQYQIRRYTDIRAYTTQAAEPAGGARLRSRSHRVGGVQRAGLLRRVPGAGALLLDLPHRLRDRPAALGHDRSAAPGRPDRPGQLAVGGRGAERERHAGLAPGARLRRPGPATRW